MLKFWLKHSNPERSTTLPIVSDTLPPSPPRVFRLCLLGLASVIASVISFFGGLRDITKRWSLSSIGMQYRGRHVDLDGSARSSPRPSRALKDIYPLPSSDAHSDSFAFPLPPHFLRKGATKSSSSKSKSKSRNIMQSGGATFLRKILSVDFKKDDSSTNGGRDIRIRKKSLDVQPSPTTSSFGSFTTVDLDSEYGSSPMSRVSFDESSGSSTESGVESDSTLYVSEDEDQGAVKRKWSIQAAYTTKVSHHQNYSLPTSSNPSASPTFTNPFSSPAVPSNTTPTPTRSNKRNPRPAYKLSDFLATKRASALLCPPDSPRLSRRRSRGNLITDPSCRNPYYLSIYDREESYLDATPATSLSVPPWHRLQRKAEVVYEPDSDVEETS